MDYYIAFTATFHGDGLSHTQASADTQPGAWNKVDGVVYTALSNGDNVWVRRTAYQVGKSQIFMQYLDRTVKWIGWPESGDELFTARPAGQVRVDWDPDVLTYTHVEVLSIYWGSNQRFFRFKCQADCYADDSQADTRFDRCHFQGTVELPGSEGTGNTPTGNTFVQCQFDGTVYINQSRDVQFYACEFAKTGGGGTLEIDAFRSHNIRFQQCQSNPTSYPWNFDQCSSVEVIACSTPKLTFDDSSHVHLNNVQNYSGNYGLNLINCRGAVSVTDSQLDGSVSDLRIQNYGAFVQCRGVELVHETIEFSPGSGTWEPINYHKLNMSEYQQDPLAYRAFQWGGEITTDQTIYRHGSFPLSYRLDPNTNPPDRAARLILNLWGLEQTYMDFPPGTTSVLGVAVHGLHQNWPAATLHQGTIWAEIDHGDISAFQPGVRFTLSGRPIANAAQDRVDLVADATSTWENQGAYVPFVMYVPIAFTHLGPENQRVPIRVVLSTFSPGKSIYIDPIPRLF